MRRGVSTECREVLLGTGLGDDRVRELLSPAGFTDWRGAERALRQLARGGHTAQVASILPHLLATISMAGDPDGVLVNLERFASGSPNRGELFLYLEKNPRAVEVLVALFSGSQFLTEILLLYPELFSRLANPRSLAIAKSADRLTAEAEAASESGGTLAEKLDALRRFQRLELLRIGVSDLLGLFDLATVTEQLSNLADGLVRACLSATASDTGTDLSGFAVLAMGKLGGRELNYSSDIDLLFLARSDVTSYWRLGRKLIDALGAATGEGFLYRVDMRLRPWGEAGALVTSPEGYVSYLDRHARLWEKQALMKARTIAGDETVGREFLDRIAPLLFGSSVETTRSHVHAMKQKTESVLRRQGLGRREVKLGEGSIRDIEFVAQFLQLAHGASHPEIRSPRTLEALGRLTCAGFLTEQEFRVLAEGYRFLRTIEHHLQIMHYRQTHILPDEPEALGQLARRLGFTGEGAGAEFLSRYQQHAAAIRAIYVRHLGSERKESAITQAAISANPQIREHVLRMDPSYTTAFSDDEIKKHALLADGLKDEKPVEVEAITLGEGLWRVTIVGYDYPGELSVICGLLFAFGFSIHDGNVFTYEPAGSSPVTPGSYPYRGGAFRGIGDEFSPRRRFVPAPRSYRRKIVDVFTVKSERTDRDAAVWDQYASDLRMLLRLMQEGRTREARGVVAKRAAATLSEGQSPASTLYPVDVEIDNTISERYTVLRIDSLDTVGFLYELTNALALSDIYIARVTCESTGSRLHDILWVVDANGKKITSLEKQRELRAATVLIKHFTHLLPRSPNPESALLHFGELVTQLLGRRDWAGELASLERPRVLDAVAQILGVSDFLWDDFLRMQHENLFPVVQEAGEEASRKSREKLRMELERTLELVREAAEPDGLAEAWRVSLNAFKDRELFRIDMRHILGQTAEFEEFSEELTELAEVVVEAVVEMCLEELRGVYGDPVLDDGQPCPLSVLALGKCGGKELGFASDIELLFVYGGNGRTSGGHGITTAEFFEKLVQSFVSSIRTKREGIFEIDLRLRPYGKAGTMAVSFDSFRRYFAPRGPAWAYERQALIKLRPIAGDAPFGQQISTLRDEFVYMGEPFDVTAMRAMRERQLRHLVTPGTSNAKYSPGALADIEYLIQGLQIRHGASEPSVRVENTRAAMAALAAASLLTAADHAKLRKAHTFFRWLIDALRVVRGNAMDVTVPAFGTEEFAFLARRLRYGGDAARLREEFSTFTANVQEMSARLLV
ncbi:MAG: Glutamate-ammonia-ligase adenylyltransferase [Thermoanaerobaculia bacterium]|nr:Glutamate-ammonia-ligase adenylyltransferase [Thermoanaerobaculia bacterium]